jgi:hypothetical protein
MKRKVRITEAQLNSIIKKALKEQQDDQVMAGADQGQMSGSPEDEVDGEEGGEPNYEAFMSAAQELMGQGITIGNLVDKLCEAKDGAGEEQPSGEEESGFEPEPDQAIPSDNQ